MNPHGEQPEPVLHDFVTTACHHRKHDECKPVCKYCSSHCLCVCHRWRIPVEGS